MQHILQILILFILTACLLKLSFWQWWQSALFGLLCAAFVAGTTQWAIVQSKTQLADLLNNVGVMQDVAVFITAESALCFAFCFAELRELFGAKKRNRWNSLLRWYPGLLLFPVLFYLQTQLIFAMPGNNFTWLSYVFAGVVLVMLPLLSFLLKHACPEKEVRLEIYFLVGLFVCIIGLITTVNGNTTYSAAKEPLNIKAVLLSLGLFTLFFVAGILLNKIKYKIKSRN
ncbi:MAG: hypothetical protein LBD45_06505 [Bacteroidales bacterium]|jgi:hypothetical protein|nr:hypothetical protein [Bacteroidales bacterium]